MKKRKKLEFKKSILFLSVFISLSLLFAFSPYLEFFRLNASTSLSPITDTLSSSGVGTSGPETINTTGVNHKITYTAPTAMPSGDTITVYIQYGSTIGSGQTNTGFTAVAVSSGFSVTAAGTSIASSSNAVVGTAGAATDSNFSGYTFTSVTITTTGAIASGDAIVINGITATNPPDVSTSTNQYVIDVQDTVGDDGYMAIPMVTNSTVTVTGRVTPSITFSLSSNSTNFGILQLGLVNTSSPATDLTLSTNAKDGAQINVYDAGNGTNPGLYDSLASSLIPSSSATLASGTQGYGIQGSVGSISGSVGSISVASTYNVTGNAVGGLNLTPTTLASATAPIYEAEVIVNYLAAISVTTPAGVYTDNVTYLASGNF